MKAEHAENHTTYGEAAVIARKVLSKVFGRELTPDETKFELALGLGKLTGIEEGIRKKKTHLYLNGLSNPESIKRLRDRVKEL